MWKDRQAYMLRHFGEDYDFVVGPIERLAKIDGKLRLSGDEPDLVILSKRGALGLIIHPKFRELSGCKKVVDEVCDPMIAKGAVAMPSNLTSLRHQLLSRLQHLLHQQHTGWPFQNQYKQKKTNGNSTS